MAIGTIMAIVAGIIPAPNLKTKTCQTPPFLSHKTLTYGGHYCARIAILRPRIHSFSVGFVGRVLVALFVRFPSFSFPFHFQHVLFFVKLLFGLFDAFESRLHLQQTAVRRCHVYVGAFERRQHGQTNTPT